MIARPACSPAELVGAITCRNPVFTSLSELLGVIAQSVEADAIQLGIDVGTGYRREYFIRQSKAADLLSECASPPFVITHETRVTRRPSPSGLIASPAWVDQHCLPMGTAGRRHAPRSGIALMRSPLRPEYTAAERSQFARLLPHLNLALALAFELEQARERQRYAAALLQHAEAGLLLLGPGGEVLYGNPQAYEMLAQAQVRAHTRLEMPSRALQRQFETARAALKKNPLHETSLLLPGPPAHVMRLREADPADTDPARAIVVHLKVQIAHPTLSTCVAGHFELTPAEFRLCAALVGGLSLKHCARDWSRSYDTLRSQLKSVLIKTSTHRQAELIALLNVYTSR